jgi:hypothetical protein
VAPARTTRNVNVTASRAASLASADGMAGDPHDYPFVAFLSEWRDRALSMDAQR